jgi:hypothetical protein
VQPNGIAVGGGVLQRAHEHQAVGQRQIGLREAHAAGLGELGHLGERGALQLARQRAERKQPTAAELAGAELEHLHQPRLVEHRVGVGRAHETRDAAGSGRGQLALEHAFVLLPGLAQPRGQVHEAGGHHQGGGVDHAVGRELGGRADADDAARRDGDIGRLVAAAGGVDDAAVADEDLHAGPPMGRLEEGRAPSGGRERM